MGLEPLINIFNTYKPENSFTNGLFSVLQLSIHERPRLITTFLKELLHIEPNGTIDGQSRYVKEFVSKYKSKLGVLHLGWKEVHDFLENAVEQRDGTFSELVRQYLRRIREQVFEQDFAGVITKIAFGQHTDVFSDSYLEQLPNDRAWHTPRPYKELDGKGRKLLLYDRGRKGITAEVEIKKVEHIRWESAFPSRNVFAGKPTGFDEPISLDHIRSVPGFENFGKYKKDRSPYRNITREQYRQLMGTCGSK